MRRVVSEISIRPMTLEDLPTVLQIDRMSFPTPWSERSYRFELQENPAAQLLVADLVDEHTESVIGYVGFWLIADEVHISTLAVHPDHRRQGVGEQLLLATLNYAIRSKADIATLEVRASNQAAIDLYQKHGFKIVGRRSKYYHDNNEDALLMTMKDLHWWHAERYGGGG
jgi:ribosomal-protein-alanine N-acetyltransferase